MKVTVRNSFSSFRARLEPSPPRMRVRRRLCRVGAPGPEHEVQEQLLNFKMHYGWPPAGAGALGEPASIVTRRPTRGSRSTACPTRCDSEAAIAAFEPANGRSLPRLRVGPPPLSAAAACAPAQVHPGRLRQP